MNLTVKGIERLEPKQKRDRKTGETKSVGFRVRDRETHGLYLQVTPTGTKSWLLRYELAGTERYMGLGPFPLFSLKLARERANAERRKLADGIDPITHREEQRLAREAQTRKASSIPTFKEASERYFQTHGDKWKNAKHRRMFSATLTRYAFPKLGALRVSDITTEDVRLAIEPIWRTIPQTANRVRGRIESVLSWSIANRYREGPNPARWADNLEHLLPALGQIAKANHHAALPYAELPEFMAALARREGVAARALEFTILTAARTGEVREAVWTEIDFKGKTWTVPADRMKGGKEHRVPLSDRVIELLKALPQEGSFVFPGFRQGLPLGHSELTKTAKGLRTDITTYGFRSTFRDWAGETTAFPNHVLEQALAHTIGSAVERAYRRGDLFDKRRKLMEAWSKFCHSKPVTATATVVPIRGAA